MRLVAVLLVTLVLFGAVCADIWQDCSKPDDTFKIQQVLIKPSPPKLDQDLAVNISGILSKTISDGTADITVYLNGQELFGDTYDICDISPDFKCPFKNGPLSLGVVTHVPSFAPTGEYKGQVVLKDQNSAEVACITFDFVLSNKLTDDDLPALDDYIINRTNKMKNGWRAAGNNRFSGLSLRDAKQLLSTRLVPFTNAVQRIKYGSSANIPDSFDSRTNWPTCVHPIRDQQQCGSCWAFGATESLSDRFCIASNGATNVVLSPEYLVSCDMNDFGCSGGYLQNAWDFLVSKGTCTEDCWPYEAGGGVAPPCRNTCVDNTPMTLYKAKAGSVISPSGVQSIQQEIMTNGPVEGAFTVYQDFFSYAGGVYRHKTGALAGGHAIKILGWGLEAGSNTPYWICANSWSTNWGMNGFFWMYRGSDECGIESNVISALPDL